MKNRSFIYSLLFAASTFALSSSCSGDKSPDGVTDNDHASHGDIPAAESNAASVDDPQFDVDQKFKHQLDQVFSAYVDLKEAFVSSDPSKVQQEAGKTKQALADVDMTLVSGAAHSDWMNYQNQMAQSLNAMQGASSLEAQRKDFSKLSDNLYKSIKAFGLAGSTAYYDYCPMAFNDEGAYWLSDTEKIRNPYFGDKMLSCGEVKKKLQ